jgi:hypothetical protein
MSIEELPPHNGPAAATGAPEMTPAEREAMERWLNVPVHPKISEAQRAFLRDLPELVNTHYRQWVAYHGSRRLGFHKSKTALYTEWVKAGIPRDELLVTGIDRSRL